MDNLVLEVQGCNISESVESSDEFSALVQLIGDVKQEIKNVQKATENANIASNRVDNVIQEANQTIIQVNQTITQAIQRTDIATQNANNATNRANDTISRAEVAIRDTQDIILQAQTAKNNANTQAIYAKEQGDYAKREADRLSSINIVHLLEEIDNLKKNKANTSEVLHLSDIEKLIFNVTYPIGKLYFTLDKTNPSTIVGGTWELTAKGMTVVGVDPEQPEFNTANKIGGSKTHKHGAGGLSAAIGAYDGNIASIGYNGVGKGSSDFTYGGTLGNVITSISNSRINHYTKVEGDTASSSNFPPNMTCYIWVRVA